MRINDFGNFGEVMNATSFSWLSQKMWELIYRKRLDQIKTVATGILLAIFERSIVKTNLDLVHNPIGP